MSVSKRTLVTGPARDRQRGSGNSTGESIRHGDQCLGCPNYISLLPPFPPIQLSPTPLLASRLSRPAAPWSAAAVSLATRQNTGTTRRWQPPVTARSECTAAAQHCPIQTDVTRIQECTLTDRLPLAWLPNGAPCRGALLVNVRATRMQQAVLKPIREIRQGIDQTGE